MTEVSINIREAVPEDAEELLKTLNQIRQETDFLTMDETDMAISIEEEMEHLARIYDSENNVLLLALDGEKIAGTISVHADSHKRIRHIGEIGISILKDYWGMGLGRTLMQEGILWSEESGVIKRLQLTVQERNARAVHLYHSLGFQTEVIMERGAVDKEGNFLRVHLMSKLIGE
ncbi:Protein N-acetyltransferase, RimJ/RimL family [Pilibacter termitis]|uniref:Protein N-acetyltransferase, RimJ/RimL family n=1 Tax=Pilibacter termitis TaxID=263852 RepID=A0A1T4PDU8_9ENTE|nr:GNAT family N-acetyltransferase [Pilibacter termitis]SJZ88978.1 Protein N-acetyltransferase, RimJ/RimL family [Pilibacter termitis]